MSTPEHQLPPNSDNVDEELRRINLALEAVFSSTTASHNVPADHHWWKERQLADRYLTSFQSTSVSWMVCDRLLQEGDASHEQTRAQQQQQRRFFAAQTLHTKCRHDMHELPSQSLPSLRDSLLHHLKRYVVSGDSALNNRLAMCVSALAVQMGWTTIVDDLLAKCQASHPEPDLTTDRMVAMTILHALPEECASDRLLLINENSRYQMRDHLVSSATLVFAFLLSTMQDGHQASAIRVLKTFHIWIRYVPVRPQSLVDSPLLSSSIQAMQQPEFLELASDVLVEVLRMYPSHHYGNESLVHAMIPALSNLPLEGALRSDDEDVLRAYCRVVTEMGESYMSLILNSTHHRQQGLQSKDASQLVGWVLRCSEITDTEISGITLHFWYRMLLDLEETEPFEFRQELVDNYATHLLKLIEVCVTNLMRFPHDIDDAAEDMVDDLHRHRATVAETIEDCCRLLGGHSVLQQVGRLLQAEVQKATGGQQTEWQVLESCLACVAALNRFVPSDETDVLPLCFQLINQLPADIRPLRHTACTLIGRYASWLAMHAELLQPLLPYLAQGLSVPECASASAVAIKQLCACSNQSFEIAEPVLHLYEKLAAEQGRLKLRDELEILEGVCRASSRTIQDNHDDGKQFLSRLAHPIGTRLAANVSDTSASAHRIIPDIDRLTIIVRFLTVPYVPPNNHPMVELLQSSWTLLDAAMNRFPTDNDLAEKICRLHKHALRSCGSGAYRPMLDALMKQLVHSFERTRQSPFLYAASICITEYGKDPTCTQRLFEMIAAMASTTFSFLRNLEEMTDHPDVVEEFFYLMGRMIAYCPDPLVSSQLLHPLTQCAVVGMQLHHKGANKGTLKFLENIIGHGLHLRDQNRTESLAALEQVLSQEGQAIVNNLARGLVGELPTYNNQIPEILWKISSLCPGLLGQWLASAFASSTVVPDRAKVDFMSALDSGLAHDEFGLVIRAFQSACDRERRFRRAPRGQ